MTRVLVVHHDVDVADIEVDELRRAGFEVDQCGGPHGGGACPVLNGQPCWQVDEADVLVYDMWASGESSRSLIEEIREFHPGKPLVVTSPGMVLDWIETEGAHGVTPVLGAPTREDLVAAVHAAVKAASDTVRAEPEAESPVKRRPAPTHPRW
jgi:DNA-binding NtrC family response regulator